MKVAKSGSTPLLLIVATIFSSAISVDVFAQTPVLQPTPPAWDINKDGVIDLIDLVMVVSEFSKAPPYRADVDRNGVVDIFDLVAVAKHFGQLTKKIEPPKVLPPPPDPG